MLSFVRTRRVAWIALCAVVFAAMSSTLASLYAQERADIMSQICSASGLSKVLTDAAGSNVPPAKNERAVYCADCVNSATWQAVAAPVLANLFVLVAGVSPAPLAEPPAVVTRPAAPPPSRGPPAAI